MTLSRFELHLSLQIDVPCTKEAPVDIRVERTDREVEFGVVRHDLIGRLALKDERSNDSVLLMQVMFGHVDAGTGRRKSLMVLSVGEERIIAVLLCNGTGRHFLFAAVADIRGLVKPNTAFLYKVLTVGVAGGTGRAFDTTENDLPTYICFGTAIALFTEVVLIDEAALVVPVREAVFTDLLGDGGRILAKETGNAFKGPAFVEEPFDGFTVIQGQMTVVAGDQFAHKTPSTAVRRAMKRVP